MASFNPPRKRPPTGNPVVPATPPPAERVLPANLPHSARLRSALAKIHEHGSTSTQVIAVLDGYYRQIVPNSIASDSPRGHKLHPRDCEKSANGGSKWEVLFFYLSSVSDAVRTAHALDAAYARVRDTDVDNKLKALSAVQAAIAIMERRTARLEHLAEIGSPDWIVRGTDATGYFLLTNAEYAGILRKEAEVAAANEAAAPELPGPDDLQEIDE